MSHPAPRAGGISHHLKATLLILRKELGTFRLTPTLYVCLALFTFLAAWLHFWMGGYLTGKTAALDKTFFRWHPWLYSFFAPAISMRLWSEEYRQKTLEFLIPLGFRYGHLLVGKFLAVWLILGLGLLLTFPVVITAQYMGQPDLGTICCSYLGSFLIAGYFTAIASCVAAITNNQFIACITGATLGSILLIIGSNASMEALIALAPEFSEKLIHLNQLSIFSQFREFQQGFFPFSSLVFIGSFIVLCLVLTHSWLTSKTTPPT